MTRLQLFYFGYIIQRVNSLEKALVVGKVKGHRRTGQKAISWMDSVTVALNDQIRDRSSWRKSIYKVDRGRCIMIHN